MTFKKIMQQSLSRAKRWHHGSIEEWTILEWAGAMAGEAGECVNAAKKVRREELNCVGSRATKDKVLEEFVDTLLYGVVVVQRLGYNERDLQRAIRRVFNRKSVECGFPERL